MDFVFLVLVVEGRAEEKGLESEVAVIRVQPPCQPLASLLSRPPAPLPPSAQSPFQPIVQPELAPPKLEPVYTDMVRGFCS